MKLRVRQRCHLVALGTVASTNDEVLARARQLGEQALRHADGRFVPLVVVSSEQTAGRGRLGRVWASPSGGLYLSVLVELVERLPAASLSPLVALAARDALQGFAACDLRVKWPNDLLAPQGKLAGILIEVKPAAAVFSAVAAAATVPVASSSVPLPVSSPAVPVSPTPAASPSPDDALYAIVGIGVNVNRPSAAAVDGAAAGTAAAAAGAAYLTDDTGGQLSLEDVATALINSFFCRYEAWLAAAGSFEPFVDEYRAHMALLGERVCVRDATGAEVARGLVGGVDDAGQLLLAGERTCVAVAAGEVTLR
jgi:BirA family biotin operon repressor/biotin-[acetyl-CoA-carboxylase] ligase